MNVMELPSLLIIPREECTNSIVETMNGRYNQIIVKQTIIQGSRTIQTVLLIMNKVIWHYDQVGPLRFQFVPSIPS